LLTVVHLRAGCQPPRSLASCPTIWHGYFLTTAKLSNRSSGRAVGRAGGFPVAGPSKGPDRNRTPSTPRAHRCESIRPNDQVQSAGREAYDTGWPTTTRKERPETILPDLSNFYCLPGRAGGLLNGLEAGRAGIPYFRGRWTSEWVCDRKMRREAALSGPGLTGIWNCRVSGS